MKQISEKALYWLIPLLFTFPLFKENFSSLFFIILSVFTLLYTIPTGNYSLKNKSVLFLTIPFGIVLIRSLFAIGQPDNFGHLNNALFFLLFPIVFSYVPSFYFSEKRIHFYLSIFKNVCALISISYVVLFLRYHYFWEFFMFRYDVPRFRDFVYNDTPLFRIHPTYFTSMVLFCTAFSLENLLKRKKYYEVLYILIFIGITFMLVAKINLVLLLALIGGMLLFRSHLFNYKQKLFLFFAFILTCVTLTLYVPGLKNRFVEIINSYNKPPSGVAHDSTNIRVAIVNCSAEVAKDNYLWGVGFDKLQEKLDACYAANYDSNFYVTIKYMTHNYFAYMLLSAGIFGLFVFLFYCYKLFRMSLKINCFLLYIMLSNILIICFTEDFFYRHYGIFFFHLILMTFVRNDAFRKDNTLNEVKNQED